MKKELHKILINAATFALLLVPTVAPILSPNLRSALSTMIGAPNTQGAQLKKLQSSTPLLSKLTSVYATTLYYLGVSANPSQMTMGKDGYMFLGNDHNRAYAQITHNYSPSQSQIENWVNVFEYEKNYLAARGIPMFFIVAPSTGTIYSDKIKALPPGFANTKSVFDLVLEQTIKKQLPLIDVRQELFAARSTAETYSKLNSHWNDYGAWVAWQKLGKQIESISKNVKLAGMNAEYQITELDMANEAANLLNVSVPNLWNMPVRNVPFSDFEIIAENGNRTTVQGETKTGLLDLPRVTHSPNATSNLRVLVFTDSMGTSLSPYWTASFKDLRQVNHHNRVPGIAPLDFRFEVEQFKPEVVLYVMTERYFDLPLGNLDILQLPEAFGKAPPNDSQFWPKKTGFAEPQVSLKPQLSESSSIKLADYEGAQFLKLTTESSGPSLLYIGYLVGGVKTEGWHEIAKGSTSTIVAIPEHIDGNYVTIVRDTAKPPISLVSVELRAKN